MQISEKTLITENIAKKKPPPIIKVDDFLSDIKASVENQEDTYLEKFKRSIMDQQKDYPPPVPVLRINQNGELQPFLTRKSFSLWQGKQKSKKTTVLALAVAAFVAGVNFNQNNFFQAASNGVVLFFDNEQGESYAARTMKLILKLAGVDYSSRLIYCDLREYSPADRKQVIKAGIESTPDVELVVIDGLVDLLTDFMDASEGHITTADILKLCSQYNIHVAGVLHQNKNDKNARAHIGTISSQKCEVEISTEVDPDDRNQSFVICVNSRGLPFEQFAIRWDKGSLPKINEEWTSTKSANVKAAKKYDSAKEMVEGIFRPFTALSHSEAIQRIMNATLKSESTAKRLFKDCEMWNMITKGPDGNWRRNTEQGSRVHEGSKEGS